MTAPPPAHARLKRRVREALASVRLRMVWWFVVVLAIATVASVLAARQITLQRLDERIDQELIQEVREVELLAGGNDPDTGQPFSGDVARIFEVSLERNVPARSESILTFVDGRLTGVRTGDRAPRPESLPTADWAVLGEPVRSRLVTDEGAEIEYQAVPFLVDGAPTGVFVVAIDREVEGADTDAASIAAALVGLLMLVVGSLLAFRLADRMLAPVRTVRDTAQAISESDLSQRIPLTGYDEISDLAATFNEMLDRLEAAFAAQRRFIDDAGHELRTPITIIRGHLDTLGDDAEDRARTLELLDGELDRVRRMVDDLITLARSERPDFLRAGPVDLGDLTRSVVDKARGLGDRDWTLEAAADEPIWADEQRLTQAVLQLAENAVRHTATGGRIGIGSAIADGNVRLWVTDDGAGVPPAERERIFERFFRGRDSRRRSEGSGLGLSIVAAIADAHGGRATLDPPSGDGSTFGIIFPLRRGAD